MDSTQTAHLDADTLAAYVDGRLAADELGRADHHIDSCRSCRLELSTLAAVNSQPSAPLADVPEGSLGRYHVLRELGRGSMGIVLRAYDPELARPVAIKLVRDVDASTRELLRREARALAKLRHPEVVTVYDVVVEADGLYVAMELVEGDTLRGHCKGRPTKEILAALVRAGRGLAAAHDAGVIHRDFKPENVLCGAGGEVKVSDFGLARAADELPDRALAGTPAYMAPEVLRREPATAASDQFSFCVTAWEMLTGDRPTGGAPKASLAFAPVPAWIIRVLRRGLERDPAARYPSMHVLVAALADDPVARRRRRGLLAIGGVAALAAGALIVKLVPSGEGASCALDNRLLGDAWTPARRQAVTAALTAAADAESAERVAGALEARANDWLARRRDACVAGRRHDAPALQASRLSCLDRDRRQLGALVDVLSTPDKRLAATAEEAVDKLADPAECATRAETLPQDPGGRVLFEQGRTALVRANALQWAGEDDEADTVASNVLAQASTKLFPALEAEALLVRARVEIVRGHLERAESTLFDVLHAAEKARDDMLVATAWVEIVNVTGTQEHRFDLALSNARAADAALARIDASTDMQLRYAFVMGSTLMADGKLDEARQRLESVKDIGLTDPKRQASVGMIELSRCDVARQQGHLPEAHALCESGIKRIEAAFGPRHMRVAVSLSQLGALAFAEHDLDAAQKTYERSIAIFELRHNEGHYAYALALANLGTVFSERGDLAKANELYGRSLAMFDRYHPEHPQRLMALQGLANLALRRNDGPAAVEYYQTIRDVRAATYAPEHPLVLSADFNLALAYDASKDRARAIQILTDLAERAQTPGKESWVVAGRALDVLGKLAGFRKDIPGAYALRVRAVAAMSHVPETAEHAYVERHLGADALELRKAKEAIEPLERALAYYEQHQGDPGDIAITRGLLAMAVYDVKDMPRALALARQARDELASAKTGEGLEVMRRNMDRLFDDVRKDALKRQRLLNSGAKAP